MERTCFAALWSALTLSAFSVFITLVVGIREVVRSLSPPCRNGNMEPPEERGSSHDVDLLSTGADSTGRRTEAR
jgi:hypothetical protein